MSVSFQKKLTEIMAKSQTQNLTEEQVKPDHGEDVTHGVIDGTGKINATGPVPTGAAGTLKTSAGPTTSGPTGHIPQNSDLPKKSYGLDEEKDDEKKDEKKPPFLKKKEEKKLDEEKKEEDKKLDEEKDDEKKEVKEEKKESKAEATLKNEESDDDEDKEAVSEATSQLFSGENLSEAFKTKTATIFEDVLSNRIKEYRKKVLAKVNKMLNERVEEIREDLSNKVEGHLDLVVENWVKTHEPAIESQLKTALVEDFITEMKTVWTNHFFEVPSDKMDVVTEMANRLQSVETRLTEQIDTNAQLKSKITLYEKAEIFNKVSKGLPSTQVDRLKNLAEHVAYTSSDLYETELNTLKESLTPKTEKPQQKSLVEQVLDENGPTEEQLSKQQSAVKEVLARMAKK